MDDPSTAAPRPYRSLDDVPIEELMPLGRALARLLHSVWLAHEAERTKAAPSADVERPLAAG